MRQIYTFRGSLMRRIHARQVVREMPAEAVRHYEPRIFWVRVSHEEK
jgi:hypothetical protein